MKEKNLDRLLFLCIGILISFFLVCLFAFIQINSEDIPEELNASVAESEQEIINNCSNLDVVNTSNCLVSHIKTIFIYNVTDDEKAKTMSFEEIKKRGTDCGGYAYLYMRLGNSLNFNATTVRNNGVKGLFSAHRYAVIWDDKNYCRIDQLKVGCFKRK